MGNGSVSNLILDFPACRSRRNECLWFAVPEVRRLVEYYHKLIHCHSLKSLKIEGASKIVWIKMLSLHAAYLDLIPGSTYNLLSISRKFLEHIASSRSKTPRRCDPKLSFVSLPLPQIKRNRGKEEYYLTDP